ncbi:hypothetical protein [uncultured Arcticibacterium sp.]|uniref:hypothetical protein n=1 Tax=uncultured Arcticibacterium sp. TaxID=2173042 RepID=UPI0030F58EAD
MKIVNSLSSTVLILLLLFTSSCEVFDYKNILEDNFQEYIPPPNRFTIDKDFLSFELVQKVLPGKDLSYNYVENYVIITNTSNENIDSVEFVINAFETGHINFNKRIVTYTNTYTANISPFTKSDSIFWNSTLESLLNESNVQIHIIKVDTKPTNKFSGVYEGEFDYRDSEGVKLGGFVSSHIDRIGTIQLFLPYQNDISMIKGNVTSKGVFSGTCEKQDGTILEELITNKDSTFKSIQDSLIFSLFINKFPKVDTSSWVNFTLIKQQN